MNSQFSQKVSDIIEYSKEEANRLKNGSIRPEHLLLGILRDANGKAIDILQSFQIDTKLIKQELEHVLLLESDETLPSDADLSLSEDTSKVLKFGILEARKMNRQEVDTEHVLLGLLKEPNNHAALILGFYGVDYDDVQRFISNTSLNADQPDEDVMFGFAENEEEDEEEDASFNRFDNSSNGTNSPQQKIQERGTKKSSTNSVLNNFCIDLTKAAESGKLDPIVGREKEIERLAQILSRRKKNNPILIGEPGVGKSAIVEGLALRIVQKKVPRLLFNKQIFSLDLTSVVAGTKFRGQFEERMRLIINELQNNPHIILFIDEIHTIIGAGSAPGTMDAANMLKPALARGEIQCIGATTIDEYRKSIEKDGALERRFQKVLVEASTPEETLTILHNIKERYEDHHNVVYTDDALEACVKLTGRYITDRNFPDKAIDALDEAGARVFLSDISVPKEIETQEELIEQTKNEKNEAVKLQNFELAASYRDKERTLTSQLEQMKQEWEASMKDNRKEVTADDIADVVSMMSGIPVQRMAQAEGIKLAGMKENLQSKVIAQDTAIDKLVKAILRSRVGLKDPNRPIGTFMFLGPTGVGKTHLAKELAEFMFGSSDALIRIDMSEYMEKFTVSRLVGAPPGYVGYEEGGVLTEKVRRRPYSIILFDEIEKAHPDTFNLLLQVMDEGRLTDSNGRTVDFKNTVIIMTSNIGTRQLKDFGRGVGFATQTRVDDKEFSRSIIQKALNKSFAPEFLNRIDEIITFDQLSLQAVGNIVGIELKKLYSRLKGIGYEMVVSEEAKQFIASKGYDVQFGARPLKRAIQSYLEDVLSEKIISSDLKPGDVLHVVVNAEKDCLEIEMR